MNAAIYAVFKVYITVWSAQFTKSETVYFDKKQAEGKPSKVAVIACVNKLIHWVYAILTKKEAFRLS
ncbi:hypothetical protein NNL21_00635 [Paenibacillus mendelii]|nr:hypothetical protein [Paenibacillus mendelii]